MQAIHDHRESCPPTPPRSSTATDLSSSSSFSPHSTDWTLDIVKRRVQSGVKITPVVVDIGDGVVVKYGDRPLEQEARTTQFVARHTKGIRIPKVYAVFRDPEDGSSYMVQEKLPGVPLMQLLPTLDATTRNNLAHELKGVFEQLALLNDMGPMGVVGSPGAFNLFFFGSPNDGTGPLNTPEDFIKCIPNAFATRRPFMTDIPPTDAFNFERSHVFSHGDLVPENILVLDGHVSGIIDWAEGGWYPYFWNDWIARWRNHLPQFRDGRWAEMSGIMTESFPAETELFSHLAGLANLHL